MKPYFLDITHRICICAINYITLDLRRTKIGPLIVTKKSCIVSGQPCTSKPSANSKSKFFMSAQTTIIISCLAKVRPTQFDGPNENGIKASCRVRN